MSIEEKQNYLRESILDKGYDGNMFMQFLQEKKGEEINLEKWSLEELTEAVEEFINKISNSNAKEQSQQENKQEKTNKSNTKGITEEYLNTIRCQKSYPTKISTLINPKIKLSLPEKIEGGLFHKSYVSYLVEIMPLQCKTRKRYSDFEWLRNMLSKVYLGTVVPKMPKKNYSDRFNEIYISKRMRKLEKFMNGILADPLMKESLFLNDFLTIENESEWNDKKSEYNEIEPINKIKDLFSLTGTLHTSVSSEKEMYLLNIKDNVINNQNLLQKLIKAYKDLILSINNVSEIMENISDIWSLLNENSQKYYDNINTINCFNIMNKFMQNWSDSQKRYVDIINIDLKEYFSYIKNEFSTMNDIIKTVEEHKNNYYKAEQKLNDKKENLFDSKDIDNWEIEEDEQNNNINIMDDKDYAFSKMLPKETMAVNNLKIKYGFYLNKIIDEYERISILNGNRNWVFIKSYFDKSTNIMNDLKVGFTDLLSYYTNNTDKNNNTI